MVRYRLKAMLVDYFFARIFIRVADHGNERRFVFRANSRGATLYPFSSPDYHLDYHFFRSHGRIRR